MQRSKRDWIILLGRKYMLGLYNKSIWLTAVTLIWWLEGKALLDFAILSYLENRNERKQQSIKYMNKNQALRHAHSNDMNECSAFLHYWGFTLSWWNLSTLTHCILCPWETLVSCCRGNAAWIHMITFLMNFPIPIATICPLLHTTILKEKIFTSMSRKLFKILGLFYDP